MSGYHEISVHRAQPLSVLLADLSTAAGAELTTCEGEFIDYAVGIERAAVELELRHDFEQDFGIPKPPPASCKKGPSAGRTESPALASATGRFAADQHHQEEKARLNDLAPRFTHPQPAGHNSEPEQRHLESDQQRQAPSPTHRASSARSHPCLHHLRSARD
jgi:hypothetical protein